MDLEGFFVKHDLLYATVHKNDSVFRFLRSMYGNRAPADEIEFLTKYKTDAHNWKTVRIHGFKMRLDLSNNEDLGFFYLARQKRLYEPKTSDLIIKDVRNLAKTRDDFVFVDVGASDGWYTLLAAPLIRELSPRGNVMSFEPSRSSFYRLRNNVRLNKLKNVELSRLALGSKKTKAQMNISGRGDSENSLLKTDYVEDSVPVQVDTLDNVLKGRRVDLIKIDVEGLEEQVLAGAKGMLSNRGIRLVLEYNHKILYLSGINYDLIFRRLISMGFTIREINDRNNLLFDTQVRSHADLHALITNLYCYRE